MIHEKVKRRYRRLLYMTSGLFIGMIGRKDLVLGWKVIFGIFAIAMILIVIKYMED